MHPLEAIQARLAERIYTEKNLRMSITKMLTSILEVDRCAPATVGTGGQTVDNVMPELFLLATLLLLLGMIWGLLALSRPKPLWSNPQVALAFPLPGIAEALCADSGLPLESVRRFEREFRRWFAVAAASPVMVGMSSRNVDSFWHVLLARSELYRAFSMAVCGRVVDHVENVGNARLDARCWVAYREVWKESPPRDIWGQPPSPEELEKVKVSAVQPNDSGLLSLMLSDGYSHDGNHAASHDSHHSDGGHHSFGCGGGGH